MQQRIPLRAAAVLILAGLAACQAGSGRNGDGPRPIPTAGDLPESQATDPGAAPTQDTATAEAPEAAGDGDRARTAVLPPVDPDPARLMGAGGPGVRALLGEPDLLRREAGASVWQYRATGCVLDVYLYPEGGERRVLHLEARDAATAPMATPECLKRLLRRQQIRRSS